MKKLAAVLFWVSSLLSPVAVNAEDLSNCVEGWRATQGKRFDDALALYEQCIKEGDLSQASLARTYRNIGITLRDAQRPKKAVDYYRKAIALEPYDVEDDYVNLGNAYDEAGDLSHALQSYSEALRIHPNYGEALYNRGITYERTGDYGSAKSDFIAAYSAGLRTQALFERLLVHDLIEKVPPSAP